MNMALLPALHGSLYVFCKSIGAIPIAGNEKQNGNTNKGPRADPDLVHCRTWCALSLEADRNDDDVPDYAG